MALSSRSGVVTLDPSLAPLLVSEKTIGQYFQVATATILVYHAITTLDKEVKYFWGVRLNAVSVVYFANRYIGIFGAIIHIVYNIYGVTLPLCNLSVRTNTNNISYEITIISIDYILMIRVLALYSRSRRLALVLKTLLGLEAIATLTLFIYVSEVYDVIVTRLGLEGPMVCGTESLGRPLVPLAVVSWLIPMVYGVILVALALYKAAEFWRESSGFKGFKLMKVLIVDQAIYFAWAVACCVLNIVEFKLSFSNEFQATLLESLGNPSLLCVLGSTMLFNLKEAGERGLNQGTSYRVKSISAMEFA